MLSLAPAFHLPGIISFVTSGSFRGTTGTKQGQFVSNYTISSCRVDCSPLRYRQPRSRERSLDCCLEVPIDSCDSNIKVWQRQGRVGPGWMRRTLCRHSRAEIPGTASPLGWRTVLRAESQMSILQQVRSRTAAMVLVSIAICCCHLPGNLLSRPINPPVENLSKGV